MSEFLTSKSRLDIYNNEYFKSKTFNEVEKWIKQNHKQLIGSAIFSKNKSLISKIVSWAESWKCKDDDFKPSL